MTGYQFLPPLTDAEYEALRGDIAANGMRHPIIVDEKGKILDGHHRARIAAELGFKPEREVAEGLTDQEKRDLAFTLNAARRHMDGAQRRAAVIASLKADPQLSDRQHARRTGVTHPTVAGIRAELVAAGRLESLSSRLGADGRERPATRTPASRPEAEEVGSRELSPATSSAETPARRDPEPTQGESAVATTGGPDWAKPPAWDPEERKAHEDEVARRRDIEAARRTAQTIVTTVRSAVVTVVTGCRYGERGLVTKQMVADLRDATDLLETEIDDER